MRKGDKRPGFTFKNSKGVEYEVLFYKPNKKIYNGAVGLCYDPNEDSPKIYIDPYQSDQAELNTAIHEFAHAFFWEKTEKEIKTFADTMSRFLYNECHWRKKRAAKKKKKK
jgi:hypothetical protein